MLFSHVSNNRFTHQSPLVVIVQYGPILLKNSLQVVCRRSVNDQYSSFVSPAGVVASILHQSSRRAHGCSKFTSLVITSLQDILCDIVHKEEIINLILDGRRSPGPSLLSGLRWPVPGELQITPPPASDHRFRHGSLGDGPARVCRTQVLTG